MPVHKMRRSSFGSHQPSTKWLSSRRTVKNAVSTMVGIDRIQTPLRSSIITLTLKQASSITKNKMARASLPMALQATRSLTMSD